MLKSIFNDVDVQLPEQICKAAVEYLPAFLSAEDTEELAVQALLIARAFDAEGSFEQVFTDAEPITRHYQIQLENSGSSHQCHVHSYRRQVPSFRRPI